MSRAAAAALVVTLALTLYAGAMSFLEAWRGATITGWTLVALLGAGAFVVIAAYSEPEDDEEGPWQ